MCKLAPIVFVDFSFFKDDDKIIVKELACRSLKGEYGFHNVFFPPTDFYKLSLKDQYTAQWQVDRLNMIEWSVGEDEYSSLHHAIQDIAKYAANGTILVKGLEKMKYLKERVNTDFVKVVDMETEYGTPSLKVLASLYPVIVKFTKCNFHHKNCVLQHIQLLHQWYVDEHFTK